MTAQKATMADWLALHGVTAQVCRAVLDRAGPVAAKGTDPIWPQDPDATWRLVADLLTPCFPEQTPQTDDGLIGQTWARTQTDFSGAKWGPNRAFTLHDDGAGRPLVVVYPKGRLSDLTTLAHEFGHAAQIVACAGVAMPPVLREVCACLSEQLVLRGLAMRDPARARVAQNWLAGRSLRQRQDLRAALDTPDAPYRYDWNHPLARAVVGGMAQMSAAERLRLFSGHLPLIDLIQ